MRARLKVSRAGVELIKSFEGLRTTAARLPDGRWTLGYGHTFSAREGATVKQEDADALLRFDLLPIVDSINNLILVPVNQNQFDALVSFCFNIGVDNFAASGVLKRINEGRMTEAALAMDSWRSAEFNGQTYVLAPLIRRRAAEKNLFLTPEEVTGNAPSLLIRPVEDAAGEATRPTEVDAPDRGGILSAHPTHAPEPAPAAYTAPEPVAPPYAAPAYVAPITPAPVTPPPAAPVYTAPVYTAPSEPAPVSAPVYTPPFEISATPQPVAAPAPVAPVERQVIDLTAFAPRTAEAAPVEAPVAAPPPVKPTIQITADYAPSQPVTAPAPTAAPAAETVVEHMPFGATPVAPAAPAAGVVEQSPTAYDYDAVPVMSPEVQAALARAQDEQKQAEQRAAQQRLSEETQRQAEANVAARMAEEARQREDMLRREEARLHELQRQEALRLEQERLERDAQMRAEMVRLEQARLEAARADQERQDRERHEAARLEAIRLETARLEQERADRERLEAEAAARAEAARAEAARIEAAHLEAQRAEAVRVEQARLEAEQAERERQAAQAAEQARIEQARAEQARIEQAATEQSAAEQARLERERAERENLQRALSGQTRDPAEAEKTRKADAAAALMRLYSPYGSGALGRPLTPGAVGGRSLEPNPRSEEPVPAAQVQPQPQVSPATPRAIDTPQRPEAEPKSADPEPEPAAAPAPQAFSAPEPQPVPDTVQAEPEDDEEEDGRLSNIFTFTPPGASPSTMPPPQITALNPYARPVSQPAPQPAPQPLPQAVSRPEALVEVPRPAPVDLSAPSNAPFVAAQTGAQTSAPAEPLHWREQLQRPLPSDYQPQSAPQPEVQASLLHPATAAPEAAFAADGEDNWTYDGGRIALSNEEMEEETVSWWRMIVSTLWWILISAFGLGCLGFAAAAYYRAAYDPAVLRNGTQGDLTILSVIMAAAGIFFVCISVWLIMKRLGGLKD